MIWVGVCIFIGKAFTNALSWLSGTSQLLKNTVKNEAMVDALWCVYARRLYHLFWCLCIFSAIGITVCYIHVGVRLLRCSFYSVGNAKASDSGMSNSMDSHAFLFLSHALQKHWSGLHIIYFL